MGGEGLMALQFLSAWVPCNICQEWDKCSSALSLQQYFFILIPSLRLALAVVSACASLKGVRHPGVRFRYMVIGIWMLSNVVQMQSIIEKA